MSGDWTKHLKKFSSLGGWYKTARAAPSPAPPTPGVHAHGTGLPGAVPQWAPGTGFGTGEVDLGDFALARVTAFEQVWNSGEDGTGASFYRPADLPAGFHSLGCVAQTNSRAAESWALAIRASFDGPAPALVKPKDYALIWTSADWAEAHQEALAFFWAPAVPPGYKALGFVVTNYPDRPGADDMVLVREDLTEAAELQDSVWDTSGLAGVPAFSAWTTKPAEVCLGSTGIPVNAAHCVAGLTGSETGEQSVWCLKNVCGSLALMPSLEQLGQIMDAYGPSVVYHPDEEYLPATPQWFFDQGALLYTSSSPDTPVRVGQGGANLPPGDCNDGDYWLDLPSDDSRETVKKGDLSVAKVCIQVKPMLGSTATDLACWVYHCFNGSSIARLGIIKSLSLGKIGEHISDWEHFTLRVDNFSGELRRIYMAQHSGGAWFRPDELEFVGGNRAIAYSARNTHAMYATQGEHLQGDGKMGVGIRNDTAKSSLILDTSTKYEFINVDYLGKKGETGYPEQPAWVEYMREWGPSLTYDSRAEIERILKFLPALVRNSVLQLLGKLPVELGGEEGPTGPKEKNTWFGDER